MKKKILALCLVVALLATAIAGATLAYFNDETDAIKNTFTMGKVDIDLDEPHWKPDENGKNIMPGVVFPKDPTITVAEDSEDCYVFLDVTVNKFMSLAWVMAKNEGVAAKYINENGVFSTTDFLTAVLGDKTLRESIVNDWFQETVNHADWKIMEDGISLDGSGNYLTIRLAYIGGATNSGKAIVAKGGKDIVFMESFGMPASVTDEMIAAGVTEGGMAHAFNTDAADFEMIFKAYAIQADTLADVEAAYDALFD